MAVAMVSPCRVLLSRGGAGPEAHVRFDYDDTLRLAFRNKFPSAKWCSIQRLWTVPGKTAVERAGTFFTERGLLVVG